MTIPAFDPKELTVVGEVPGFMGAAAREYAARFCNPDKPSMFNLYGSPALSRAYREELYIQSRKNYSRTI